MSTFTSIYLPTPDTTEAVLLGNSKSELQTILNGCATDLARYDAEIATARATLTRLESERQSLEDFRVKVVSVNASLHLDAPVYRLPTELLADILEITTRERYQQDHNPLYQLANGRLLELSTVCSRWHTVALGTSVLWTTIFVRIRGQNALKSDFGKSHQDLLRAVLARSSTLPLQIHLDLRESISWALAIYPLLVAESERWSDAHLTLDTSTTILIGPLKNRLPILRRLTLENASFHIHSIFESAPSITHVFVELASPFDPFPKLPVAQLRRLVVVLDRDYMHDPCNTDTLELASDLLEKCSEACSVAILGLQVTEGGLTDPVVSRIKTLELSMNGLLPSSLESWDMPCLETLSIEGPTRPLVWSTNSFSTFAARSRSLTRLDLKGIFISAHELASSLEHVPALCELSVADGDRNVGGVTYLVVAAEFFRCLTLDPAGDGDGLVPKLERLTCTAFFREFQNDALLHAMLASRMHANGAFAFRAIVMYPEHNVSWPEERVARLEHLLADLEAQNLVVDIQVDRDRKLETQSVDGEPRYRTYDEQ